MTVKELYEWAVKNGAENFDVKVPYSTYDPYYDGYYNDCTHKIVLDTHAEDGNATQKIVVIREREDC